jgi:hypothetical protein
VRWAGLLCSAYFFVMPAYRHSFAVTAVQYKSESS